MDTNLIREYEQSIALENRKEHGVFYTPAYIVRYMLANTLGKLCYDAKSSLSLPAYQRFLLDLKVCDPATGAGVFLLAVFDFLQKEHQNIVQKVPSLEISEINLKILKHNIFGVDIDPKAVELCQKLLAQKAQTDFINPNIKVGNSLIDDPNIAGEKAFVWAKEFLTIFQKGGFDVIIGNPPYGISFGKEEKTYLTKFDKLVPDYEAYIYFISLYKRILKPQGILSYIFPNTFLSTVFGEKYRKALFSETSIYDIVNLSEDDTFADASVRTCIVSFINEKSSYQANLGRFITEKVKKVKGKSTEKVAKYETLKTLKKEVLLKNISNVLRLFAHKEAHEKLIEKIQKFPALGNFYTISQGLIPYDKYRGHDEHTIKNRIWHANHQKDTTYKKELKGADVNRYQIDWNGNLWLSYGDWLAAPREAKFFTLPRILIREITNGYLFCGYTEEEFYNTPSIINMIDEKQMLDLKYSLSVLNSRLIGWYHNQTSPKAKKGLFPKILVNDVRKIPIPKISQTAQQAFVAKANKMLQLHQDLQTEVNRFLKLLQAKLFTGKGLKPLVISKKLQHWHTLENADFFERITKGIHKGACSLAETC